MRIELASVLLLALVVPFIMTYRIGPGETPYLLFGLIFGLLLANLTTGLWGWPKAKREKARSFLSWLIIITVIGSASLSAIIVRHRTSPIYQVHDMVLQQEAAIRFLLQGKNPYATSYFGTLLEQWHYSDTEVNPALFHFVMMPWYLLFSLPFYFASISLFSFFDGRLPLVFLFLGLLILAWRLLRSEGEKQRLFLSLLAFNPATLGYFLEGRADVFMFAFLFWAWYLLEKKRYGLAGIPLALALATKQSAWPVFPFYFGFLWLRNKKNWAKAIKDLLPFVFSFAAVVLPFALWNFGTFWESTVAYLAGSSLHSYPVSGYGWGMVLGQLGVIRETGSYYPFWIWQAAVCLPLMTVLLRWLAKSPVVWRLVFSYGVFTFVFWYFSRYFNNSHIGYLSMVFLTAYFWPKEK